MCYLYMVHLITSDSTTCSLHGFELLKRLMAMFTVRNGSTWSGTEGIF